MRLKRDFKLVEIDESHIGGKRSAVSNRKRKELFGTAGLRP
ncbi:MAG: hypothetical protein OXE54_06890 [Gammaproteobacteria bacterium]|nr:hypothetical protein [Gammaproteobacteria bacterium]